MTTRATTNFPIVRITDSAGRVVYCRTHNWLGGVATGTKVVQAGFDIPGRNPHRPCKLVVVANGIASAPVSVTIN